MGTLPGTPAEIRQQLIEWREQLVGRHPQLGGLVRRVQAANAAWSYANDQVDLDLDPGEEAEEGTDDAEAALDLDLMNEVVLNLLRLASEFEQARALGITRIDDALRDGRRLTEDDLGLVSACVDRAEYL